VSTDAGAPPAIVEEVAAGVTYPLRGAVLRVGRPVEISGDDDPATFHLAARTEDGQIVGVVRFHPNPCPWRPEARAAWQLRGMATDPAVRGAGVGRALVAEGLTRVARRGGDLVWCDARAAASGFYARIGFAVVTEPYELAPIGPHLGMVIKVPRNDRTW
jgi:predicted GNAT family N-acyltransferase